MSVHRTPDKWRYYDVEGHSIKGRKKMVPMRRSQGFIKIEGYLEHHRAMSDTQNEGRYGAGRIQPKYRNRALSENPLLVNLHGKYHFGKLITISNVARVCWEVSVGISHRTMMIRRHC